MIHFEAMLPVFQATQRDVEAFNKLLQPLIDEAGDEHERLYFHHIQEEEEEHLKRLDRIIKGISSIGGNHLTSVHPVSQFRLISDMVTEEFGLHNFKEHLDLAIHELREEQDKITFLTGMKEEVQANRQRFRTHMEDLENFMNELTDRRSVRLKPFQQHTEIPLSESEWERLTETVVHTAKHHLVGRRFIEIHGPLGAGVQSIPNDIFQDVSQGTIDLTGEAHNESHSRRVHLSIPLIYKDFTLNWRDIELARTMNAPLDVSPASNAAQFCAMREDDLIFNGHKEYDLPGLLNVQGRLTHIRRDWSKSGNAFQDIVDATSKLLQSGHSGPYALILSPDLYALLHRVHTGTNVLEIEHIQRLITAGVYQSPMIRDEVGVIVNTGRSNLDLAVGEDFNIAYLGAEQMNHPFRVYETVTIRIKRPASICTLENPKGK